MSKRKPQRFCCEGAVPLVDVEGSAHDCGRWLGYTWAEKLRNAAAKAPALSKPWWKDPRYKKLISRIAPHLPEVYRAMAHAAGLPEDCVSTRAPVNPSGCTSFAIQGTTTLDSGPISGQTKDPPMARIYQFQVLRMKMTDAPSALSLTYEGWLYGHGFVAGGCAIFRNSLYAGDGEGLLPYDVWGILALHCANVDKVIQMTRDFGVHQGFHTTVADEHGGIVGIENTRGGLAFIKPKRGIYTHANAVVGHKRAVRHERCGPTFLRHDSLHREARLYQLLAGDLGRLTAQLAFAALSDHDGYPVSICRHQGQGAVTCAAVVVEPTKGLLHATRGSPCQNWPNTYEL